MEATSGYSYVRPVREPNDASHTIFESTTAALCVSVCSMEIMPEGTLFACRGYLDLGELDVRYEEFTSSDNWRSGVG